MPIIRLISVILLLATATVELTGCGKKGDLEPPPAKEEAKKPK
ncbi:MAG: lipoprotein [Proteobacteria bacterium]|nr:lipoprotein [Pseudomonadota bacterium]